MEEIIKKVGNNWSKDLIIRFLYIKLAPYFKRDLLFFLANEEEKFKQYKQGFINRFPDIVCSTLADFYVDLFSQYGINSKKIVANSAKIPLYSIMVEGDEGWYFLDPLSDLFSNQYGLRPYFFGIIPRYKTIINNFPELVKLPLEYLDELDKTLNFEYLDKYFIDLHITLSNRKSAKEFFGIFNNIPIDLKERKLQFFSDELINLGSVNGTFERAQLYNYLNTKLLNNGEKRYTTVRIVGGIENPHISIETEDCDRFTLYEEEKQDDKYVLVKKDIKYK